MVVAAKTSEEPTPTFVGVQRMSSLSSGPVFMLSFLMPFFKSLANDLER